MLSSIEASSDILPQPDTKNWHFKMTILVAIILNASKVPPLSDSRWQLNVSPSIPCCPPRWNYTMRWTEAACRGRPRTPGPCPGTAPPGSRAGTSRRSGRARRSRYAGTFSTEGERFCIYNCQRVGWWPCQWRHYWHPDHGDTEMFFGWRSLVEYLRSPVPPSPVLASDSPLRGRTQPPNLNIPASIHN